MIVFIACNSRKETPLFELMVDTGIDFENKVIDGKIENGFTFRNFYNGGGVAVGDINNDGFADVCFTSNMGSNKIYLNKTNWTFEDITPKSGFSQDSMWSTGIVMADLNSDGWLDIYISNSGHMKDGNRRNKLYINNHNLTFTESAKAYGLDISAYTTQVSFFDYDIDGDLDCFMINNSPIPINTLNNANRRDLPEAQWQVAGFLKGGGDHLFRNDNGYFTDITKQAGIHGSLISFGLGVTVGDMNSDGYPDIYVANDSYERDYLYINQRNGTYADEFEKCMKQNSFSSMGADLADINNDGYQDIFTTDMLPGDDYRLKTLGSFDNIDLYRSKVKSGFYHQYMKNCLQLNNGDGTFSEISNFSGVSATDWSWGALMFDADNDGLNDIYVCNGVNRDVTNLDFMDFFANDIMQKMVLTGKKEGVDNVLKEIPRNPMVNKAFRNTGNLMFTDSGESWGFTQPSYSNGAAYGDLDNDGDLDMIVNNINQPAFIYRNNARELNKNNHITVSLKGSGKNSFAIGSLVSVYVEGQVMVRELMPSRGFQSSVDYRLVFGLGNRSRIDSITVTWPDLRYSAYYLPQINKMHVWQQSEGKTRMVKANGIVRSLLMDSLENSFDKHQEDDYVDFYYERNLPEMLSREGPGAASGDVNGDGLTDIFIGGASGRAGQLYFQTNDGRFTKKTQQAFEQFADFEDVAVSFFDCDQDKDLDLVVCPGGNNVSPTSRELQLRLYKNDSKGNFEIDPGAFLLNGVNISVAQPSDFDGDGDLDLFIGGRSVPRDYGLNPSSYLFVNDGNGHFSDIAKTKNTDIANIGMVTGAAWADVTGDNRKELIIVGDWMYPRIFTYDRTHFKEVKTNLSNMYGWWQTVTIADVNGDGRQDLLLGNIGENFYLRPDQRNPVKIWINDFDGNGIIDKVLTRTVGGKDKPVFLKRELEDQIPKLKKLSLKHHNFAGKSIQDLFEPDILSKCLVKQFNYPSSCIAINNGNGHFTVEKMPPALQLSSLNAIHAIDINQDGFTDLVTGGNSQGYPPQFGRLDADFGNVLINDGKGKFNTIKSIQSGLKVSGEIHDIIQFQHLRNTFLLFIRNDEYPALYRFKNQVINKQIVSHNISLANKKGLRK